MPSWPIEMPSETEIVPNSSGKPPAARTPSLARLASRSSEQVARGDLVPGRRDADLRLAPVVVAHADGAQHGAGRRLGVPVGHLVAARLDVGLCWSLGVSLARSSRSADARSDRRTVAADRRRRPAPGLGGSARVTAPPACA